MPPRHRPNAAGFDSSSPDSELDAQPAAKPKTAKKRRSASSTPGEQHLSKLLKHQGMYRACWLTHVPLCAALDQGYTLLGRICCISEHGGKCAGWICCRRLCSVLWFASFLPLLVQH